MNVLILDPDPVGAGALEAALVRRGWGLRVEICATPESAWAWLEQRHPTVVFLDLNLPDGAGLEFLITFREKYPGLPVILWTDYALLEDLNRLKRSLRPLQLHNRRVDPETLTGGVRRYLAPKPESHLHGIRAGDFFELLARENKTCRLRLSSTAGQGDLYFSDGVPVHAEFQEHTGEAAFADLLALQKPEILVFESLAPRIATIHRPLAELLV